MLHSRFESRLLHLHTFKTCLFIQYSVFFIKGQITMFIAAIVLYFVN